MLRKPWPIVVLAVINLIAPFYNAAYSAWLYQMNIWEYCREFAVQMPGWKIAAALLLQPIAGIAIWAVKSWSYPIFIVCYAIQMLITYSYHNAHPEILGLGRLTLVFLLNCGVVGFFLLRTVRAAYFDPRLRWWEAKPRYLVDFDCKVELKGTALPGQVTDLSTGGVFVATTKEVGMGTPVVLEMQCFGLPHRFSGRVVHVREHGVKGFGIQFDPMDWGTHGEVRRLIHQARLGGAPLRNVKLPWHVDFYLWLSRLVTTGQGLVPDVPAAATRKKSD